MANVQQLAANLYGSFILAPLTDIVMRGRQFGKYRTAVVSSARGRVLEIGAGSGLNFPFYGKQAGSIVGIDPSPRLLAMARRRAAAAGIHAELIEGSAEAIPLATASVDTAVMTWALCSIPAPLLALDEIRRVLKPDGRLVFAGHGLSPDAGIARRQRWWTPLWCRMAGGCHLDRKMGDLIRSAGFELAELKNEYAKGPTIAGYMYVGCAVPAAA
jgi:ubiquinone/menaquinone biosynthesis C-methylase UbiE